MDHRLIVVREFLSQAIDLKRAIDRKHDQLRHLQRIAKRGTAVLSDSHSASSDSHRNLEDAVLKICSLHDELAQLLSQYSDSYSNINKLIQSVSSPKLRELLELRYLNFLTWEKVADTLGKTHYHVTHRMHHAALAAVYNSDLSANFLNMSKIVD